MKREMNEREKDLNLSQQQYQELRDQLQDMLNTIADETDEITKLEAELREGEIPSSTMCIQCCCVVIIFSMQA
jgi:septal ring factor EnvC (AmiA/AmiB activator)